MLANDTSYERLGLIIARASNTAANLVVFSLIVWRTKQALRLLGGSSLSKLLVKQGALHFVSVSLLPPFIMGFRGKY